MEKSLHSLVLVAVPTIVGAILISTLVELDRTQDQLQEVKLKSEQAEEALTSCQKQLPAMGELNQIKFVPRGTTPRLKCDTRIVYRHWVYGKRCPFGEVMLGLRTPPTYPRDYVECGKIESWCY